MGATTSRLNFFPQHPTVLFLQRAMDAMVQHFCPLRLATTRIPSTTTLLLIFFLSIGICPGGRADDRAGRLSGRVVDRESGQALESANVFLSNTLRGTVTGRDGAYVLTGVKPGNYQLVASRVGYVVAVENVEVAGGDSLIRDFALVPRTVGAGEVEVLAESPVQWREDLKDFQRQFLGSDEYAEKCAILNSEVLNFRRDPASGLFHAATDSVLRIRNTALGFNISVMLGSFVWDPGSGAVDYTIYVRFANLVPAETTEREAWERNRGKAYRGSSRHFLKALSRGEIEQEGFLVSDVRGNSLGAGARKVIVGWPPGGKILAYDGILRIDYTGETRLRRNFVRLAQGLVHVRPDGSLIEQQEFLVDPASDWAQHRVARMLPMEYESG
jgi:hypothetical protein